MSHIERVEIGECTLYCGDCREVLPTLGKVDAVVTDPPYGINVNVRTRSSKQDELYGGSYRTHFDKVYGDNARFDPTPWLAFPCILWGANNYCTRLPDTNGWLVWYKAQGIEGYTLSPCELAYCSTIQTIEYFGHLWHGYKRASQSGEKVRHPTEKPVALMRWCLRLLPPHATILDPYMGSGTTGVACVELGRSFIGVELEPRYFDIACRRIEEAQRQPRLFPVAPPQQLALGVA